MNQRLKDILALPAVRFAPFFAVGLLVGHYFGIAYSAAVLICAAILAVLAHFRKSRAALCAAALALGIAEMMCWEALYCAPVLSLSSKEYSAVRLRVVDTDSTSQDYSGFTAWATLDSMPVKIRFSGESRVSVGDTVTADISISANNEETEEYRISKGLLLSGRISEYHEIRPAAFSAVRLVRNIRNKMTVYLRSVLNGEPEQLAMAFLFGEDNDISPALSEKIAVSGAAHFTAVSGTHFTVMLSVLLGIFPDKRRKARASAAAVCIPIMVMFYGASASVIRAAIMLMLCNTAPLFNRRAVTLNSLCVAVILMTAVTPNAILDVSMQLSVLGVLGVITGKYYSAALMRRIPAFFSRAAWLVNAVCLSLGAVLFTAPLCIQLFGGISSASILTSVIILPLISAAMVLMLVAAPAGFSAAAVPLILVVRLMSGVVGFFGNIRSLWLAMDFFGAEWLALFMVILFAAAAAAPERFFSYGTTAAGVAVLCSLVLCSSARINRRSIDFISNGKSGAAIVCAGDNALVYAAGTCDGFADELAEALRKNGIRAVRQIIAPDLSYSGAVELGELCRIINAETICTDENELQTLRRCCPKSVIICGEYSGITINELTITSSGINEPASGDIIMYTGSKKSEPQSTAALALYVSSAQKLLPENGINIYKEELEIRLPRDILDVTINER